MVPSAALANPIGVDIEADTVADDGHCSLREAVTSANLDAPSGATPGECAAGSGADVLMLPSGTYLFSKPGAIENNNATGDLDIGGDLTIAGSGAATTTIYAAQLDRVLDITSPHTVTVAGVTLAGGRAADGLAGGAGQPGTIGGSGGGIRNTGGTLSLTDVVVRDNVAGSGGAAGAGNHAGGPGGAGGGISSSGPLTLTNTVVEDNSAGSGGRGGQTTTGTGPPNVSANTAQGGSGGPGGAGGGIASSAPATLVGSALRDNSAGDGGTGGDGLAGDGGSDGNGGGGLGGDGAKGGSGGGLSATGATTTGSSTIDGNRAGRGGFGGTGTGGTGDGSGHGGDASGGRGGDGGNGGGIAADAPTAVNVTVDRNVAGTGGTGGLSFGGRGGDSFSAGFNASRGGNVTAGLGGNGGPGGGLWASGTSHVTHATMSANRAGGAGPGTHGFVGLGGTAFGGGGAMNGNAGSDNASGQSGSAGLGGAAFNPIGASLTLANTVSASNSPATCGATVADGGHDLSFPFGCPGTVADPRLGALAANGGPVETRALEAGSPAIDAVPSSGAGCAAADARGVARPQGAACDAGAYEAAPAVAVTGAASGVSVSGATLSGAVTASGRPARFHFDYGTTTSYGVRTAEADAGAGLAAAPVTAAIAGLAPSTTYHYRLVATNADGTGAGADQTFTTAAPSTGPPPPGSDVTPPVISRASARPNRFRAKKGSSFGYTLSERAQVAFTIEHAVAGRRVGGRCRKPTRANSRRRKCTRYTLIGPLAAQAGVAGANVRRFSGRVGGRRLKPGGYRVTLIATDAAGNHSKPARLGFNILRP